MRYLFRCPSCKKEVELELTIAEYSASIPVCEDCNVALERVYEMPQVKGGGDSDEYSDSSMHSSSCDGTCAGCTGCQV